MIYIPALETCILSVVVMVTSSGPKMYVVAGLLPQPPGFKIAKVGAIATRLMVQIIVVYLVLFSISSAMVSRGYVEQWSQ